jgi:hypothetical protein
MRTVSLRWVSIALVTLGLLCCCSTRSHAQDRQPVPADFKGAVGLGLVGAELGAVIPALAVVDASWAYIVFPVVGAAGGAVGGYFAIDHADHAQLSVAALALGMALVIPALVITLSLTAYDPGGDTDNGEARNKLRRARQLAAAGPGMLRVSEGELALAAPGIALVPGRPTEPWRVSGVSLSLFSGQF